MGRSKDRVRLSSKGQIVIPAELRRRLGLVTGRVLRLRAQGTKELVLSVEEDDPRTAPELLERAQAGAKKLGLTDIEDFHQARIEERIEEARRRERRGD